LVRSTVRLARLTFGAAAASVFLYDEAQDTLVFEASSGTGEDRLVGVAIPADQGIAGWVFRSGEPIIQDVVNDPRFYREFAIGTGYVPRCIMAAPLEFEDKPIGVIEVLDPERDRFGDMAALDLLSELAAQSAGALSLLLAARSLSMHDNNGDSDWERLRQTLGSPDASPAARDLVHALTSFVEMQQKGQ